MFWVTKGNRAYEYRSVRRSGRVAVEYLGGAISAETAAFFRQLEVSRRAEREAARAAWVAERDLLVDAERQTIEIDEAYRAVAEAALLATDHHNPQRGRWRKRRRPMANEIRKAQADVPLPSESAISGLLDLIERSEGAEKKSLQEHAQDEIQRLLSEAKSGNELALPPLRALLARRPGYLGNLDMASFAIKAHALAAGGSSDVLIRSLFVDEIRATAEKLAGPDASPLEVLLCQRVALANFDALHRDTLALESEMNGCSNERAEFLSRMRGRSNARLLAACRSLATVRRLALPVLHLTISDRSTIATPPIPGPAEAPAPTLRLRDGS